MIAALFKHRSGRIIAMCRTVFAAVFFAALLIEQGGIHPDRPDAGFLFLSGYLALSVVLLAIAMRSWWWDHRLAWPMLIVDALAFLTAVFLTEDNNSDFTSPFLAIFTFVMLGATIRWNWRVTALTGVAVTALYLTLGVALQAADYDLETIRFGRRAAYMMVLSLLLIWFGLQRREQHIGRFSSARVAPGPFPLLEEALAFAIAQSGARAGAIAWNDNEEPQIELRSHGFAKNAQRLAPAAMLDNGSFGQRARIFSADRKRSLQASPNGRPIARQRLDHEPFADLMGVGEGLAVPVTSGTGSGEIVLTGIGGICEDHVAVGTLIARELQAALDRQATLMLLHESALARSREALARDLHDSVAQSLAGAAMRLEGLRNSIRAGNDPDPEIVQVKEALRTEQAQVRAMIERLRATEVSDRSVDVAASASRLLDQLASNWGIVITCDVTDPIAAPPDLEHAVSHILREAVANAVRHGEATAVSVAMTADNDHLAIDVADDGTGFCAVSSVDAPRSIRERVTRHGGSFAVKSDGSGTRLSINLPLGDPA